MKNKEKQLATVRAASDGPVKRLAELETFRASRKFWPGVIAQLRSLDVSGVSVSQVRITDALIAPEKNPFEPEKSANARWQNAGSVVVVARNEAGIGALEDFMTAVKSNGYIKPLLHRKKPARVLNNIEIADAPAPATLFTVEYPLQDKAL